MDYNDYFGHTSYISKYERKLMHEDNKQRVKDQRDEYFNSNDSELNDVWEKDSRRDVCYHRFHPDCKYRNCAACKSFFSSKDHDAQVRANAIEDCIKLVGGNVKPIVNIVFDHTFKSTDMALGRTAKNELIQELITQLEELKRGE